MMEPVPFHIAPIYQDKRMNGPAASAHPCPALRRVVITEGTRFRSAKNAAVLSSRRARSLSAGVFGWSPL